MIDVEPQSLVFRDVRLNQAYTTSLCLTNPLSAAVDISLKPSSQRYTVTPARITLSSSQSIVVTVRLFVAHFPNYAKGVKGQEDSIMIKSSYFEQKIDVSFFLHKRDSLTRSPSPQKSFREVSSSTSKADTLHELQQLINSKDITIRQLKENTALLEEKYPNFQQVLRNRLAIERQAFEEKSEKVLHILQSKDEQIADLEAQLKTQHHQLRQSREALPPPPPPTRPDTLASSLQNKLTEALRLNEVLKKQLRDAENEIESLKSAASAAKESSQEETNRTTSRLQEKVIDQAEQIEVLVQEITQLRAGEPPSSQKETKHKADLANMQHHIYALRQEIERLQNELAQRPQRIQDAGEHVSAAIQCDIESVSDSTPSRRRGGSEWSEEPPPLDRGSALYKERAERVESELAALQQKYDLLLLREQEANMKWHESQQHWEEIAVQQREISQREEGLREKEEHLIDREKTLHHMLGSVSEHCGEESPREISLPDAHAWWAYVYHEMKKQHHEDTIMHSESDEENEDGAAQSLLEQHKNTMRSQAIEIATLRQDVLMKNMKYKQQLDALRDECARSQRDNFKLQSYISAHRGDREIKINELQTTIRLLSSRSELHQTLASVRQELEEEKLVVHHLRSDIDSYRALLEEEHKKVGEMRKSLQTTQNELNASEIAKSIITVPGANAATLIELFSGRLMYLQEEVAKLQTASTSSPTQPAKNWRSNIRSINEHSDGIDPEAEEYDREINVLLSKATPETLPDVLDAVLLARKVQQLTFLLDEQKILMQTTSEDNTKLRQQLQEFQGPEYDLWHKYNDRLVIQRNEYEQRYEICHCKFEAAMHELELGKVRISELEDEVHNLKELNYCGIRRDVHDAPMLSDDGESSVQSDEAENMELREVKALLRERTIQLKVLMETLDVLQLGGQKNTLLNMDARALAEELSGQWECGGDVWGMQALVKRVVDLTAEVGSNTSTIHMLKKQVRQLESEKHRSVHEYQQTLNACKAAEDSASVMQAKMQAMSEELRVQSRFSAEQLSDLRKQCSSLQEKNRETEAAYRESQIRCDSMKAQIAVNDEATLQKWLSEVFCDQLVPLRQEPRSERDDVKQLIVTLLVQWRDQVGFYPRAASGPISKAEQKFLNRVTRLVLEAYDRCHRIEEKLSAAENQKAVADARYELSRKLLESSVSMLHRYRCRADAAERIPAIDELYLTKVQMRSDALLKNEIASLNDKLIRRTDEVTKEKRRYAELAAKFTILDTSSKKLKAQLVQIESNMRFPKSIGDGIAIDEKLRAFELQMHKWFKVELPRLITGIPVEEDQFHSYVRGSDTNALAQQLGIEKTYALSQALCSAKTEHATLASQLQSSRELTSYYKERVMSLENVIYRWRSEFEENDESVLSTIHLPENSASVPSRQLSQQLEEENLKLSVRVRELEEAVLESSARFEHARDRSDALKLIVDNLRRENNDAKQEHALHLNQIRHELNERYISELKEVREAYEMEKSALANELQKFAEEIHSADVPQALHRLLSQSAQSTPQQSYHNSPSTDSAYSQPNRPATSATPQYSMPQRLPHSAPSSAPETNSNRSNLRDSDVPHSTAASSHLEVSSASQSEDSIDDILAHETGLWTRVQQRTSPTGADLAPPQELTPPNQEFVSQLRQQVEILSNDLRNERLASTQARDQVRELEELLEKQRESFRNHLEMERDIAMLSTSTSQVDITHRPADEFSVSTGSSDSRPPRAPSPVIVVKEASPSQAVSRLLGVLDGVLAISSGDWQAHKQHVLSCVRQCQQFIRSMPIPQTGIAREEEQPQKTQQLQLASPPIMDRATSPMTPQLHEDESMPISAKMHALERKLSQEHRDVDLSMLRDLQERVAELEAQDTPNPVHQSYEKALREAQDALDHQMEVSRDQLDQVTSALEKERSKTISLSEHVEHALQENEKLRKHLSGADSSLEGVARMQQLLASVTDELEASKRSSKSLQSQYETKLQHLQSHFERFEAAQRVIVQSLESQLKQAQDTHISEVHRSLQHDVSLTDEQIEYEVLTTKIASKRSELNAVLRAMVVAGCAHDEVKHGAGTEVVSSIQESMMQARLKAADKELEMMSEALAKERAALTALKAETEREKSTVPATAGSETDPGERLKNLARRANTMRKQYVHEIDGLKAQLTTLKESETALKNETNKLKSMIVDYKDQISVLREDNARKAKLVSSLKSSKSSEANAIEQYRNENNELDEKCKRLQRALSSKEEIIKDLKNKQHAATLEPDHADTDGGDITSLTPLDLRKRIKSLELERGRTRARLSAYKEKIDELEAAQKQSATEEGQVSQLNEKIEHLKLTLSRKDILIKSYKEQIDKMKVEIMSQKEIYESHRDDFEKQIRSLQRQIDFGEKRYRDFASEYEKMKDRLTANYQDAEEKSAKLEHVLEVTLDEIDRRDINEAENRPMRAADVSDISLKSAGTHVSRDELEDIMSALRTSKDKQRVSSRGRSSDLQSRITELLDLSTSSRSSGRSERSDKSDAMSIEKRLRLMISSALDEK